MTPEFIAIIAVGATIFGSNVALWVAVSNLSSRVGRMEGLLEARTA